MAEYRIDIEKSAQNILDKIYERFGVSAERLVELAKADREGRCVMLPPREFFKALGDNVYIINYGEILEALLFYIGYNECGVDLIEVVYAPMCEDEERFAFGFSDVGKTVFLNREAAEKALEEMENK